MKKVASIYLDDRTYEKIKMISTIMGVSVPQFLTQCCITDVFKDTVNDLWILVMKASEMGEEERATFIKNELGVDINANNKKRGNWKSNTND